MELQKESKKALLYFTAIPTDAQWWAESIECYCHLRNVQDLLSDGKTTHERRFEEPFTGPLIPFGARVEHHPISAKDQARLINSVRKYFQASLWFCVPHAGGSWKRDILVANVEEFQENDTSEENSSRIKPKEGDKFIPTLVMCALSSYAPHQEQLRLFPLRVSLALQLPGHFHCRFH